MTAPSPAPVWPDEATVERVALAVRAYLEQENTCSCHEAYRSRGMDDPQCAFHAVIYMDGDADIARAALSVLPDPTADTVLLGKIREIVAGVDVDDLGSEPASYLCADAFDEIAALLAGGDR